MTVLTNWTVFFAITPSSMKRQSIQPFLAGGLFLTFFKALAATVLDAVFTGLMGRKTLPNPGKCNK